MEKRTCQRTGLELSVLGLGCWAFGGESGDYWGEQSQQEADRIIREAIDLGINYFDTAELYNEGRSEASLGKAIKGIPRDKVVIGAKIPPSFAYKDRLQRHCEASLKRLQTDYIDLYMIHWPINPHSVKSFTNDPAIINHPPTLEEAVEGLQQLREEGKIRHIGISNFGPVQSQEILALEKDIAVNQLCYNLLSRAIESEIVPLCRENGIGIIAYMPLQQALLSGKYQNLEDLPEIRRRTRHFHHRSTPLSRHGGEGAEVEVEAALSGIARICEQNGMTMPELALKWCIANPAVTSAIAGTRNVDQLRNSAQSLETSLSAETMTELDRLTRPILDKLGANPDYFQSVENSRSW